VCLRHLRQSRRMYVLLHTVHGCTTHTCGASPSPRACLCDGCSLKAVATAVELLEESGLPPLCAAIAMEEDARRPLGQLLAEAAKVSS